MIDDAWPTSSGELHALFSVYALDDTIYVCSFVTFLQIILGEKDYSFSITALHMHALLVHLFSSDG